MKKAFSIILLAAWTISVTAFSVFANDLIDALPKCCCDLTCIYYKTSDRSNYYTYASGDYSSGNCSVFWLFDPYNCHAEKLYKLVCPTSYNPFNVFDPFPLQVWSGDCNLDCPGVTALGAQHPGLNTLRQFRDRQLTQTAVGKKLTNLYYKYSFPLVVAFIENPSLQEHAKELLEKVIPRIDASMKGQLNGPLLDGELYAEAEMLLDEIDLVLSSPLKKDLISLKDEAREAGLVE